MVNTNLKRNPSIAQLGLKKFLDDSREKHRGMGYEQLVSLVGPNPKKPLVDKANLSRAFGVSRTTIYSWLDVYAKERA